MKDRFAVPFVSQISAKSRNAWLGHLRDVLPELQIEPFDPHQDYSDTEVAIVANPDPEQLQNMPNLKWVQSLWAGVEKLVDTLPDEVAIVRMTDPQLAKTMAEAVLTMTLYLHRDLPNYATQQANEIWEQHAVTFPEDRKVGVLGLGALGRAACDALFQNGFDVLGWSRSPKSKPNVKCYSDEDGLAELLSVADIVVVLLPLTNDTLGLLDKSRLSQMKRGASVINFARAQIIDGNALINSLETGHLQHAVLDVFEVEPIPMNDPLWSNKNLTILPHVAAPTSMKTASRIAVDNIISFLETGRFPQSVDRTKGY